jgi:Transposase domain (DUF772)
LLPNYAKDLINDMIDMGDLGSREAAMMGQRQFETKLYYQLSLDRLVPQDHLLRRLAAAVDFSFVRSLCRPFYSHTGQPSVDPVVIFKMLLVGYLYGITSERRLAQEVSLHGSSFLTELTRCETGVGISNGSGAGTSSFESASRSSLRGLSQSSTTDSSRMTGMRLCTRESRSLGVVVMIVNVRCHCSG